MPTSWNLPSVLLNDGHLRLALEHVDLDRRLVVLGRREGLRLAGRDRRVALDQLRHHAALGLDAERQRGDVEQEHVLDLALEHAALDRGADRDDLVRVDALVRLLAEQLGDLLLHGGHAGHAADEHDVVDAGRVDAGVGERLLGRADRPLEQRARQLGQLRARQLQVEVLRALGRGGDERQVDLRRHRRATARSSPSRPPRRGAGAPSCRHQVDALILLELGRHPVDDRPCRSCRRRGGCHRSSTSPRRRRRRARAPTRRTCRRRGRRRGSSGRRLPCRARRRALPRSAR